jgi:MoaA/NifB/PqqE/SkfB family radical SAM enzyme
MHEHTVKRLPMVEAAPKITQPLRKLLRPAKPLPESPTPPDTALRFRHYLPKPGHPDWARLQEQAMRQVAEVLPNLHKDEDDTVFDKLRDRARILHSQASALNNFRINRQRLKAGNHAFRPLYFIWSMINACNFRCSYCEDNRGNAYPDLEDKPLDLAGRIKLLERMRTGTSAIYFCGGEPTMLEELPVYTDVAYHLDYHPLMINTNGFNLHLQLKRPGWRKWLRQMDTVIISLDSLDVARLKEMWGVSRVEQVLVNLLMLRELRKYVSFKLMVNAVVLEDTVGDVSDLVDFICDLGDTWFVAIPAGYNGDKAKAAFASGQTIVGRDDFQTMAAKIRERKRQGHLMVGSERILEMFHRGKPPNCLPTLRPQVDPDGLIAWPCRASKNVQPLYLDLLEYENLDQAWDAGRERISATNFFGEGHDQCGDVCMYMKTYTTARYFECLSNPIGSGYLSEMMEFVFSK